MKRLKQIRYILEYYLILLVGAIIRLLPRKAIVAFGKVTGDFIYFCIPLRKRITLQQLEDAFPEKQVDELRSIAREAYRNLATSSIEHLCFPGMSVDDIHEIVKFPNFEILERAYSQNKGVICVGGHFGNWEYMGSAASMLGYPVSYVVAKIDNPHINAMINNHRKSTGVGILSKKGMSVRGIMLALRKKGIVAMLMDQNAGRRGIFLNYFGKQCSTVTGPALFALKTGAPMLFVANIRCSDGTIDAVFEEITVDYDKGVTDENVAALMQSCTSVLEKYVRQYPGHWFWMHRRWKTRPSDVKKKASHPARSNR